MIPVNGSPFCGDQQKAKVTLRLAGLTDGKYYVLGDELAGELTVIPAADMQLSRITLQLEFLTKGVWELEAIKAKTIHLPVPQMLRKGQVHKFPVRIPYRFSRAGYQGEHLKSFWRLNVLLDADPARAGQSFVGRALKVVSREEWHGTSFRISVRYGKGTLRASPRALPMSIVDRVPALTLKRLSWMFPAVGFFTYLALDGRINPDDAYVILVFLLIVALVWLIVRLSIFQLTPMELRPLRDGQLRLRILDRGNNSLKKAVIGYRLLECYTTKRENEPAQRKTTRYQKELPLAEVARREEYYYEAVLPWPETDLPVTGKSGSAGYEWEVFIQLPNPLTGGTHEKSWPINVSWEQFRLAPPTAEELEQEALEELKLKELERLPRM